MINVTIVRFNRNIITIEATGHSGYAEAGHDIVCSAVSTLTENLISGLERVVGITPRVNIDENIPHLSVSIPKDLEKSKMHDAQILMQTTYLGLIDARDSFKKFIKIKEMHND